MVFRDAPSLLSDAGVSISSSSVIGSLPQRVPLRRLSHAKSYGRYRPTAYRFDMRVTGQDNLWPSNTPPCRSRANRGGSLIFVPGAALTFLATRLESYVFSALIKKLQ